MKNFLHVLICSVLSLAMNAQNYADSEVAMVNGACVGCSVVNPSSATDGNPTTCTTLSLGICGSGTCIDQDLIFSTPSFGGNYVGVVISDPNLILVDQTTMASVEITTFSNSISNGDTQNSSQYSIKQIPATNSYSLEFFAAYSFDMIQVKLMSGTTGGTKTINVYYGYYAVGVLPVEVANFEAEVQNGAIKLQLETQLTESNAYFTIEKSSDAVNFLPLAVIEAEYNASLKTYEYKDSDPVEGVSYYRLKLTNSSGGSHELQTVAVEYTRPKNLFSVFPNPAESVINFSYSIRENSNAILNLYNANAVKIKSVELSPLENRLVLSENLEPGCYYYEYVIDGRPENKEKLIVLAR